MIEVIKSNIFPIVSIVIAVSAFIYGRYREKKNRKEKKPGYRIKTNVVIEKPDFQGLEISYNKKKVKSLAVTRILFMNEGQLMIDRSDVPEGHSIQIGKTDKDIETFKTELIYSSREANSVSIRQQNDVIFIDFDYLNQNDGFVIHVLHSLNDKLRNRSQFFEIRGEVKGVDRISQIHPPKTYDNTRVFINMILFGVTLILAVYLSQMLGVLVGLPDPGVFRSLIFFILVITFWMFILNVFQPYLEKRFFSNVDKNKKAMLKILENY